MNTKNIYTYITHAFLVLVIFCGLAPSNPEDHQSSQIGDSRPLRIDEIMQIVRDYENILNKNSPTVADFNHLIPDDAAMTEEKYFNIYCEKVLKVNKDSKKCNDIFAKSTNHPDKYPDIYLLNVKYNLTDGASLPIKIYVDPGIKSCSKQESLRNVRLALPAVIDIGNSKFKKVILDIACNTDQRKYDSPLSDIKYEGKWTGEWPFKIDKLISEFDK